MIPGLAEYYLRWYHSKPVAITPERQEELKRLHGILYRVSEHFSLNYRDYVGKYMPLGDKELEILELQESHPFAAGTWRPDYIITEDGQLKICEITSRFFGHGIFMTQFAELAADNFMKAHFPGIKRVSHFPALMDYMAGILGGKREIYVLRSSDPTSELRLYADFYRSLGCQFTVLETPEVEARRSEWARPGVFLISALNQADILGFSSDTWKYMVDAGMFSDFRNIFLIHDKRFMRFWFKDRFTQSCLSPEDAAFLREHSIETSLVSEGGPMVQDAIDNKNGYILKPCRLGKSEGVHAGTLTSDKDWKALWKRAGDMILQPFLPQRTYSTVWESQSFQDYLCGMMLCVNDRYFGNGLFRFSSLPVTNIGDDRKGCAIETGNPEILNLCDVL